VTKVKKTGKGYAVYDRHGVTMLTETQVERSMREAAQYARDVRALEAHSAQNPQPNRTVMAAVRAAITLGR
jgi:hypothetical protein